jgi:glycosyltransferase involved in cell wall biosynthesis
MRFRFITSTPLNITEGSGTYTGIATLAQFLKKSGHTIELITPKIKLPLYTVERILFNEMLRWKPEIDDDAITVGFDMDGYTVAGTGSGVHVASIKGVIADEMRFESGLTHATLAIQARCEKLHIRRADLIIAPSEYSAGRIRDLYGSDKEVGVVPEPIDLASWKNLLERNPAQPETRNFTVLTVCRFYPRKRLDVLLKAAARLHSRIPSLELRIVGDGPDRRRLKSLCSELGLDPVVHWLGNISQKELVAEYNRCHMFCLPSVQESFGIVFLEAMASGKPVVAARAASAPEVVRHGILVEPENEVALAEAIEQLYRDPELRTSLASAAAEWVSRFDAPTIAAEFVRQVSRPAEQSKMNKVK